MAKYCDSDQLEHYWFQWIVAKNVPILEPYREAGVLYTKIVRNIQPSNKIQSRSYCDPWYRTRSHLITLSDSTELRFTTTDNIAHVILPPITSCIKTSIIPPDYYNELPTIRLWQILLEEIHKICTGISKKFILESPELNQELADESLLQVAKKLKHDKLKYIPGKAPVFNLLTTTIYRCMYSTLNKESRRKENIKNYTEYVKSSTLHICSTVLNNT